tara:strand:- start:5208 stop:5351 length:144 start_codon:yes stop_codon:yes gene_type:complete
MSYTNKTFYVPAEEVGELHKFQEKCKEEGWKSYSQVLMFLIKEYNRK